MTRLTRSIVAAAALAVFTQAGLAQTRVDRSGATDANNRVGSGGRNTTGGRQNPWDVQNNIVYGNVTGGKEFRGNLASTDPQAFRSGTGSRQFDNFVRDSSGVTTGGVTSYNANTTRTYYGDSRVVAPPAGFVGARNTGGYTPPVPTAWQNYDPRTIAVSTDPNSVYRPITVNTNTGGDPSLGANAAGAPLTQGQPLDGSNLSDYTNLNTGAVNAFTPGQIKQSLSDDSTSRLPGQTPQVGNNPVESGSLPQQTGAPQSAPGQINRNSNGDAAGNNASGTSSTMLDNSVSNAVTSPNGPQAGTVTRMLDKPNTPDNKPETAGTAARAAADDVVAKRPGGAAELASRDFNEKVRAKAAAAKDAAAKQGDATKDPAKPDDTAAPTTPGAAPGAAPGSAPGATPGATAAAGGTGVAGSRLGTFAGEATNKGLTDLLTKAQGQMKDGKFATAIDTYDAAEAISPGSVQARLGRANAELGGAYYRRAENTFRQAATADPKLVAAPSDLRPMLGDDHLQAAQKDLADLVQKNPADTGAAVLLAYVYYNTGNERRAVALLDLVDKRAAGRDKLVTQLKTDWSAKLGDETK